MDFFETVKARYSYRGAYKDRQVPDADLRRIVQAGLDAPSGMNYRTTEFVIVTDKERLRRIAELVPNENVKTAPAVIVVLCSMEVGEKEAQFWIEDASAATQNVLLALTALGYVSCWIDGALRREGRAEKVAELLGVPKSRRVRIILPVGVPVRAGPRPEKKPFAERAWFNTYKA